ncbi:fatty acid synthase-like isoform X2 [Camponotus floridanus]|uniref:fatty acid synthase-like isoform X2 n=1 Tax=Camponotus floridanus TaxID=104421 RepID=UPI000DC6BB7A|nr:fatty acid synthase-like isoform X2 [Camponotus floridanus]
MSIEEAHTLDPGIRILFESTYAAIIDAGINPAELQGTRTTVITAMSVCNTYLDVLYEKLHVAGLPFLVVVKICWQIEFLTDSTTGPSYNIDTACSSTYFAMVEAYNLIRSGICDAAIVASINLCIHSFVTYQFYRLGLDVKVIRINSN